MPHSSFPAHRSEILSRYGHATLTDTLNAAAARFGDRGIVHVSPADASEDEQSYVTLKSEAVALAGLLGAKGWRPGMEMIFVVSSSRLFVTTFWGCLLAGVVPVPLAALPNRDLDSMEAEKIRNVVGLTRAPVLIDSRLDSYEPLMSRIVGDAGGTLLYADELVREASLGHFDAPDLPQLDGDDLAILQFSSGSSGMPKGVRLTHRNIIANIEAQLDRTGVGHDDVLCTWLPYFHDFGLFWGHLSALYHGMKQVRLNPGHFARRPLLWLEMMHRHGATVTNTTPTALNHLLGHMELRQRKGTVGPYDLSRLRSMLIGAEMIDPGDCRRAIELLAPFGIKDTLFQAGYGLTETTVAATAVPPCIPLRTRVVDRIALGTTGQVVDVPRDHPQAAEFTSVGLAVRHCEVRIVDADRRPSGPDRAGIIEIRGANVSPGYFVTGDASADAANAGAFQDEGWFDSGDVGFMDADGFVTITGRAKEMIIVGGHNHYPWDVERIALSAPGAGEALRFVTVCGFWNPALHREEIALFFVAERVAEETLLATLRAVANQVNAVAGFPIDSFVRLQTREIPRTSSGKVMRRELARQLMDGGFTRVPVGDDPAPAPVPERRRRTEAELRSLLRTLWSEALEVPEAEIGHDASLFHLGCNSLRASQIQGRLEETLGLRLETNFNYLHPVLDDQARQLAARDPSVEPPRTELELILRTVAHDALNIPEHDIGASSPLSVLAGGFAAASRLHGEIQRVFALTPEQAAALSGDTIRALGAELERFTGVGARGEEAAVFPLMNFQETLYFHRKGFVRNEPSRLSCFIFIALELTGMEAGGLIDPDRLSQAFDRVIAYHPMLRAVVDESFDRPHLRLLDTVPPFKVDYRDLSGQDPAAVETFLTGRGRELNDVRFEIGHWPLFLCELYRKPDGHYAFLFNIDHLLIDGYSFMHLLQEVFSAYDAVAEGQAPEVPSAGLGFRDYVLIEQMRQQTRSYQQAMEHQLSLFENLPPKAMLPFKTDPAAIEDVWFDTYYHTMPPDLMRRLSTLGGQHGVTLNSLLLAVWFKLVNLWSGQDDLIINMPVFNREQYFADARSVMGTFIDIFPVRVRTAGDEPVMAIARKVERFTRELLSVPVSSIELSRLIAQRDGLNAGSMSSLIFSNSIGVYGGEFDPRRRTRIAQPWFRTGAPGTFIDLVLYDFEGEYYINWNYMRDLMDASFVETLAWQFQEVCRSLGEGEEAATFDTFPLLPAGFKAALAAGNNTVTPFPAASIQALVAEQATRTPDAVALTFGTDSLTYAGLMERANKVANLLRAEGAGRNNFVAVLFERGIDMLVAQLGVLQAGAAYVPVDPEYPAERLGYVIDDCQASILLTQQHLVERVPDGLPRLDTLVVVDGDGSAGGDERRVLGTAAIEAQPATAPGGPAGPDDLAYMIYTSGSTGQPKGVMIPHTGIVNFLWWVRNFHALGPADDVALVTSYAFDMTLATNWTPLMCGARIHILHERDTRDVETLLRFLSERKITFLNVTPSHFSLIANARAHLDLGDLPMAPGMRIMLGGEVINTSDLNLWLRHHPTHRFTNEYGPTEVSVATTAFPIPVSQEGRVAVPAVPIGRPLANCRAYVLDRAGQICMPDVAGELCLGGVGVGIGYFNKPDRTEAAFVADPFVGGDARMYRTGDLARVWPDGNIEFLGRRDHQINLRGYRIEAGEVEATLILHPDVAQAVVAAQPDQAGQLQLVAYVVGPREVPAADLRTFVADRLPAYMVPAHVMRLDALPTTPSGKLNRKALPVVRGLSVRPEGAHRPPLTPVECKIAALWSEILGVDEVGLDDNFWEMGGDSLRAMRLIIRYREEGLHGFGLREVFGHQTVAATAGFFDRTDATEGAGDLLTVIRPAAGVARRRLLLLPYACGNASSFVDLARHLPAEVEVVAATPPDETGDVAALGARIAEAVMAFDPPLPLTVAGYSFGGHLACDVAARLEAAGRPASGVTVVAAPPPGVTGEFDLILDATDEAILGYSRTVYGFEPATLSEDELARYLRQLRAQTRAMAEYGFPAGLPLSTPALILLGAEEEDQELARERGRWNGVFADCDHDTLPGRHMLIKTHPEALGERLSRFMERAADDTLVELVAE